MEYIFAFYVDILQGGGHTCVGSLAPPAPLIAPMV